MYDIISIVIPVNVIVAYIIQIYTYIINKLYHYITQFIIVILYQHLCNYTN